MDFEGGETPASFADSFALSWTTFSTVSSKNGNWFLFPLVDGASDVVVQRDLCLGLMKSFTTF